MLTGGYAGPIFQEDISLFDLKRAINSSAEDVFSRRFTRCPSQQVANVSSLATVCSVYSFVKYESDKETLIFFIQGVCLSVVTE